MVYLDWAATARPDQECTLEALRLSEAAFANPSSQHAAGRKARELLESSRAGLSRALGCAPGEVVFTSGASESNWLVLSSALSRLRGESGERRPPSVVASGIEHPSIYDNLEALRGLGVRVGLVNPRRDGFVDPDELASRLEPETMLVLLMAVNNVTGAVQPVSEVAAAVRRHAAAQGRRVILHTDAVQALGKVPLDLDSLGADTASFSAHKIGGPRGIGALYVRSGTTLDPLPRGEQEGGLRPGTENCAGAAAFAQAAQRWVGALDWQRARAAELARALREGLPRIPGFVPLPADRWSDVLDRRFSPFIAAAAFPPVPSEVLVRVLSAREICVSSGSACASRSRDKRERIWRAMAVSPEAAASAIRISTGPETTAAEVAELLDALAVEVPRLARIAR